MANSTTIYQGKDGRMWIDVDAQSKTLTLADCGLVQNVTIDAITITLPATTAGASFTVRNGGTHPSSGPKGAVADAAVAIVLAPNSADKVQGAGFTAADNTHVTNTKATAHVGDEIRLTGDGTDGYLVNNITGTWVEA